MQLNILKSDILRLFLTAVMFREIILPYCQKGVFQNTSDLQEPIASIT